MPPQEVAQGDSSWHTSEGVAGTGTPTLTRASGPNLQQRRLLETASTESPTLGGVHCLPNLSTQEPFPILPATMLYVAGFPALCACTPPISSYFSTSSGPHLSPSPSHLPSPPPLVPHPAKFRVAASLCLSLCSRLQPGTRVCYLTGQKDGASVGWGGGWHLGVYRCALSCK